MAIKWHNGVNGRYAYVHTCKVTALATGGFLVERVGADLMPTDTIGWFHSKHYAMEAARKEPKPRCTRCGKVVAGPQYTQPDPDMPCPN